MNSDEPVSDLVTNSDNYTIDSHGGWQQDFDAITSVLDNGAMLQLTGNGWRKIDVNYEVTVDTILEFSFMSTSEGDIHVIGLDSSQQPTLNNMFEMFGTQNRGQVDFENYAASTGTCKTYMILVGQYVAGTIDHLTFINDHDTANPTANSFFKNVALREAVSGSPAASPQVLAAVNDSPNPTQNKIQTPWMNHHTVNLLLGASSDPIAGAPYNTVKLTRIV